MKLADWPAAKLKLEVPTRLKSEHDSLTLPESVPPPVFVTVKDVSRWVPVVTVPKLMDAAVSEHSGGAGAGWVG